MHKFLDKHGHTLLIFYSMFLLGHSAFQEGYTVIESVIVSAILIAPFYLLIMYFRKKLNLA